jgi:quinol monooxygenase YgiN
MEPIIITAILKPKEGFEEQLLVELKKVQAASKEEVGCIKYSLHRAMEENTFVLYEAWEDNEAIKRHVNSSHYQDYRKNIADIVSTREVYKMKEVE